MTTHERATTSDWHAIAKTCRDHRQKTIDAVSPAVPEIAHDLPLNVTGVPDRLLAADTVKITEHPTEVLLQELASGRLSSTAVAQAFLQRAGLAQKLTNCITELLPQQALERADFLDKYYQENQKPIGPLHGLPISVKEHISMKGLDLNAGFVSWVGQLGIDDALIVKLLFSAGAVFYARTTEPQTLMHLECSSNIFGVTTNPHNRNLTSGGSSGGEGALLGLKGSCLGIGTDIGGSIRSPAANNGVFGLRPTSFRLPLDGLAATMLGQEQIVPVVGPMSTSLEGIKVFMKTLIDQKPWLYDPSLNPLPWKQPSSRPSGTLLRCGANGSRKLRIGVLADDGIVRPHPPILRGITTLISRIQHHPDIEIVPFPAYKHDEAWRIISSLYFADAGQEELAAMSASSEPLRPMSQWILEQSPHQQPLTIAEVWKLTCERDAYKAAYTRHWNSVNTHLAGPDDEDSTTMLLQGEDAQDVAEKMVDVILCPVGPGVAPLFHTAKYWNYTSQWNLLDYPSLVFPTGLKCLPEEDGMEESYQPRNEQDRYNYNLYDAEKFRDAPISLQLVGRRYEDEKLIEALELILEVSQSHEMPSTSTCTSKL